MMDSKMLKLAQRAGAVVEFGIPTLRARYTRPGSMMLGYYEPLDGHIYVRPPLELPLSICDRHNRREYPVTRELLFERVVAHELVHWTGGAEQLARLSVAGYAIPQLAAYEEGIAEAGTALLMEAAGFRAPAIGAVAEANVAHYAKVCALSPFAMQRDARAAVAYLNQFAA